MIIDSLGVNRLFIKNHDLYECFVSENAQIPFLAMPDAIKAIQKLMNSDYSEIQSRIYNVKAFNPSALEFFNLIKTHYSDAKIVYSINPPRQKIVDSWPSDIDDSLAKKEWGWSPNYNLQRTINEYLLS